MAAWLSINLLSLFHFLYYFLLSLAHSLSAQVPTYVFLKQAIDLTVPELLFPKKKAFLHRIRNSFFGIVVRRLKKSFTLYRQQLNHLELHVHASCPSSLPDILICGSGYPDRCNSATRDRWPSLVWWWFRASLIYMDIFFPFEKRRCLYQTTAWVMSETQKSQTWIALMYKAKEWQSCLCFPSTSSAGVFTFPRTILAMQYSQQYWQSDVYHSSSLPGLRYLVADFLECLLDVNIIPS